MKHALIVEENEGLRTLLTELLKEVCEMRFMDASNLEEAKKLLKFPIYDLIILDYWTISDKIDKIMETLKENHKDKKIIILTTGNNAEELREKYQVIVITKPFVIEDLMGNL